MLDRVPRANILPLSELERVYDTICEKNGEPVHDKACDTFQMKEYEVAPIYWCDEDSIVEAKYMILPAGTIIT